MLGGCYRRNQHSKSPASGQLMSLSGGVPSCVRRNFFFQPHPRFLQARFNIPFSIPILWFFNKLLNLLARHSTASCQRISNRWSSLDYGVKREADNQSITPTICCSYQFLSLVPVLLRIWVRHASPPLIFCMHTPLPAGRSPELPRYAQSSGKKSLTGQQAELMNGKHPAPSISSVSTAARLFS